jgi:hypothetical protein
MFDQEGTVAKAMSLLDRLPDLAANTERPGAVKRLFDLVDLRMYLSFEEANGQSADRRNHHDWQRSRSDQTVQRPDSTRGH